MRNTRRADRVAEAVRAEVATFLTESAKDPRIVGFVTVTGAEITPDLRHARVFVSVLGSEAEKNATFEGLDSLAGHLRARLAKSLQLRVAPALEFRADETVAKAARIESLLAEIKRQDSSRNTGGEGSSSEG